MEPFTLSGLDAVVLIEGFKFLDGQALQILVRRRERTMAEEGEAQPVQIADLGFLEGELAPAVIDFDAVERLEEELTVFAHEVRTYTSGFQQVDRSNEELLRVADALRRSLEVIYQQRITFRGEQRPPSGPLIEGGIDIDAVVAYAAGVRTEVMKGSIVSRQADAVIIERDEVHGVDLSRIPGDPDVPLPDDEKKGS